MFLVNLAILAALSVAPAPSSGKTHKAVSNTDADTAALQEGRDGTRNYVFPDDDVDGERLRPVGSLVPWRARGQHTSLISVRGHFNAELTRIARDVL